MTEQITQFLLESYLYFLLYSTLRRSLSKERRLREEACGFLQPCTLEERRQNTLAPGADECKLEEHVLIRMFLLLPERFRGYLRDIKSSGALPGKTREWNAKPQSVHTDQHLQVKYTFMVLEYCYFGGQDISVHIIQFVCSYMIIKIGYIKYKSSKIQYILSAF